MGLSAVPWQGFDILVFSGVKNIGINCGIQFLALLVVIANLKRLARVHLSDTAHFLQLGVRVHMDPRTDLVAVVIMVALLRRLIRARRRDNAWQRSLLLLHGDDTAHDGRTVGVVKLVAELGGARLLERLSRGQHARIERKREGGHSGRILQL